jgi:predicted nucleic acid-binding protein
MNLVDSSAWLEYFAGTVHAGHFASAIENTRDLVVPSIVLYEVFKKILQQTGEQQALQAVAHMQLGQVIELDSPLAIAAAKISLDQKLPMADSIILATAIRHQAIIWTMDEDFQGRKNVRFFSKK